MHIFEDHEFLLSYVTDRPLPDASTTSSDVLSSPTSSSRFDTTTNLGIISPEILKPFAKSQASKPSQKGRPRRGLRIGTDTPGKQEVESTKSKNNKAVAVKNRFFLKEDLHLDNSSTSNHSSKLNVLSNLDDDFSLSKEIETQKLEKQFDSELINERDFILIKFLGKKSISYYVAKVVSKDSNEISVKYLKRKAFRNKYLLEESSESKKYGIN
ncbi:hypothetical protein ILUMI_00738 [Ignelater luminosus]|uniref:Uncharacterized protein n=1 Tax=Ignelater luminosus TaxID=2038154 RepID=A0A8K0DFW0_IGNLU|nr:hypothetical protein ILUMI_00738 [Ignelater luminosus]